MRAVICREAELAVVDRPEPTPGRGQVRLEVLRCGICGSDLHALAKACGADVVVDPAEGDPYGAAGQRGHLTDIPAALELAVGTREKPTRRSSWTRAAARLSRTRSR